MPFTFLLLPWQFPSPLRERGFRKTEGKHGEGSPFLKMPFSVFHFVVVVAVPYIKVTTKAY
jgi:hypothetical protein